MKPFKANARFVNKDGQLTPEAIIVMQPSTRVPYSFTSQIMVASEQGTVYLPSSQSITMLRDGVSVTFINANVIMNPGDQITLSAPQLIKFVPL